MFIDEWLSTGILGVIANTLIVFRPGFTRETLVAASGSEVLALSRGIILALNLTAIVTMAATIQRKLRGSFKTWTTDQKSILAPP